MSRTDNVNSKINAKETLRSNIKDYIRYKIMDGSYRPGDRIVETKLARELGVSQAPVREAILELSAFGLLEERPYSGTFVRAMSQEEIIDIFSTRAFIEEHATKRAAYRATDEQLEKLARIVSEMRDDLNMDDFIRLDMDFHEYIMTMAGSSSMKRAWSVLRMSEWTYISAKTTSRSLNELIQQHKTIFEHLKNKDASSAGAYMYLHINGFGKEVAHYYETSYLDTAIKQDAE